MRNRITIFMFLIINSFLVFGDELLDKYIEEAKSLYIYKDYEKSYSRIRFVLKYYNFKESDVPKDIKSAYRKYLLWLY